MKKLKKILIFCGAVTSLILFAMVIGIFIYNATLFQKPGLENSVSKVQITQSPTETEKVEEAANSEMPEKFVNREEADKISPSTKIVYEYYSVEDQAVTKTVEEKAPYFLMGKTIEDLKPSYTETGWEIQRFNSNEIVLRKNIESDQKKDFYTIGVYNGYVAVFYGPKPDKADLKEVTDTPVNALSEDEKIRLTEGVEIKGNDELHKFLEDYGS